MEYDVIQLGSRYGVLEISTGLVLKLNKKESAAKKLKSKLEKGSAFEGNTPQFFVNTVSSAIHG